MVACAPGIHVLHSTYMARCLNKIWFLLDMAILDKSHDRLSLSTFYSTSLVVPVLGKLFLIKL